MTKQAQPIRKVDPGAHDLTFQEFQLLYGPWRPLRPAQVHGLLQDAPFKWWIAGGWALSSVGGPPRPHEDVDIAILTTDLATLRQWLADYHLWEAGSGTLRPLRAGDSLTDTCQQLWIRRDAMSPWLMDILLTPSEKDEWLFKRDHRVRRPLSGIGRVGKDGIPYLRPEIVLLFKAHLLREKDDGDFDAVLPLLDPPGRRWLAAALAIAHPGHPWLTRLDDGRGRSH